MRAPAQARRGFTLIELLIVMTIIVVLAAFMIPMITAAMNSQRKGKATGEIAALMGGCERYRKLYGDFPCASPGTGTATGSDQPNYRRDLYSQLTGKKRLKSTTLADGSIALELKDVTLTNQRAIITPGTVTAGLSTADGATPTDLSTCDEFIDPWGNVYDYRYRILNGASTSTSESPYSYWRSPECLIVSCGVNYVEGSAATTGFAQLPPIGEYWDLTSAFEMTRRGTIPAITGSSEGYFTDSTSESSGIGSRADNITSFSGR